MQYNFQLFFNWQNFLPAISSRWSEFISVIFRTINYKWTNSPSVLCNIPIQIFPSVNYEFKRVSFIKISHYFCNILSMNCLYVIIRITSLPASNSWCTFRWHLSRQIYPLEWTTLFLNWIPSTLFVIHESSLEQCSRYSNPSHNHSVYNLHKLAFQLVSQLRICTITKLVLQSSAFVIWSISPSTDRYNMILGWKLRSLDANAFLSSVITPHYGLPLIWRKLVRHDFGHIDSRKSGINKIFGFYHAGCIICQTDWSHLTKFRILTTDIMTKSWENVIK